MQKNTSLIRKREIYLAIQVSQLQIKVRNYRKKNPKPLTITFLKQKCIMIIE